eukprot:12685089-Alexandrium_andersonii.AAC.1
MGLRKFAEDPRLDEGDDRRECDALRQHEALARLIKSAASVASGTSATSSAPAPLATTVGA